MTDIQGKLESEFNQEMHSTYEDAKRECKYVASRFMQMVAKFGGVATAKKLLATQKPSDGFTTLWLCNRLDISVEFIVLKLQYESLFTDEERAIAKRRLLDNGFEFSGYEDELLL